MALREITDIVNVYRQNLENLEALLGKESIVQQASELQQFFNQIVWGKLTQVELLGQQARWNAVTTELYRDMRLLLVEVNFARAASQEQSLQQRLQQIRQRIERLQGLLDVLVALIADEASG